MKYFSIVLALSLIIFSSCSDKGREPLKPSAAGAPGDLLLVVNNSIWDSYIGDTLRNMFAGPVPALPQNEPRFDVMQIEHRVFDKNFKTQRNIVTIKVGADQEEAKVLFQKGLWAKNQLLISIHAPDVKSLIELINSNRDDILSLIENTQRQRLMDVYHATMDPEVTSRLKKEHNIILTVPKGFEIAIDEDNFVWLTQEYRDIIQGIFIYTYDYTDPETFTRDFLTKKRNEITRKYVPGEIEGSYVEVEPLFPPLFREYNLRNKKYTAELRGLWRMEKGLAMGGPFISITQLDEERNRIVTVDGFVFAPGHDKRDLLQQLEAIILTLDFTQEEKPKETE